MKLVILALCACSALALAAPPVKELTNFELTDQNAAIRRYHFPKSKVTAMTIADHKGSNQLTPWIQKLHDHYQKRIDIDGVADVSMIPKPFHEMFRRAFRKQLKYSVMLDWGGSVVKQFGYEKGVANIYVVDRRGRVVKQTSGPVNERAFQEISRAIDAAIDGP